MHAETRGEIDQGIADIVAIANVGEFETAECAEFFFEGEEIGERLAGMEFIGERVDHRNVGIGGHFFENALVINAGDDALHPAVEIASDIGYGFARAERSGGLGVIEENHGAAHALDTDVESYAGAEGRLFENEGDKFALQRGSV